MHADRHQVAARRAIVFVIELGRQVHQPVIFLPVVQVRLHDAQAAVRIRSELRFEDAHRTDSGIQDRGALRLVAGIVIGIDLRGAHCGVVHQELVAGRDGKRARARETVARPLAVRLGVRHAAGRQDHARIGGANVHFEVRCVIDEMLAHAARLVQHPTLPQHIGHHERVPIRQVDLVHIVAIRVFLDLGGQRDAEAHAQRGMCARRKRLPVREIDRQPLPVQVVPERTAIPHNVLEHKAAAQVGLDRQDELPKRHAGLVGVADRLVHAQLIIVIIEQGIQGVLRPGGGGRRRGRDERGGSKFKGRGRRVGGRLRRKGGSEGWRIGPHTDWLEGRRRGGRVWGGGHQHQRRGCAERRRKRAGSQQQASQQADHKSGGACGAMRVL